MRIAIIGGGKMGEAIMAGWLASNEYPARDFTPDNFIVADPGTERQEYVKSTYGVICVETVSEIPDADVVLLAVKPQVMMDVLEEIASQDRFSHALYISIAAGVSSAKIKDALPEGSRLVRVMPNLPLLVAAGATTVCGGTSASQVDVSYVQQLFSCLGKAFVVEEKDMDATTALSGSGPAYVAAMIESLVKAGVEQGLEAELAEALTIQTVYGASQLMHETQQSPAELRQSVSSPQGTTLAALAAMDEAGMDVVYKSGIEAAVRRSKELGAC